MKKRTRKEFEEYRIRFDKLRDVWRNPQLSRGAKVIFMDLLLYAGLDGVSFPSEDTLAYNHGIGGRQVRNLLAELKTTDLISWEKGGFSSSNVYKFNPEVYFLNGKSNRKSVSSLLGNKFPVRKGNTFPSKVVKEISQRNKSKNSLIANGKKDFMERTPKFFSPKNSEENAAIVVWNQLESHKPQSFPTYLTFARKGLPPHIFFQFASEVKQDPNIRNKGAVFYEKATHWLEVSKKAKGDKGNE
jgi:hypothetical protein